MGVTPRSVVIKGVRYTRQDYLMFEKDGNRYKVKCVPYDDHWLYETNDKGPRYRCTCGSAAVVVTMGDGVMFVCQHYTDFGCHTTGARRWV
jgi:hypothetical protein